MSTSHLEPIPGFTHLKAVRTTSCTTPTSSVIGPGKNSYGEPQNQAVSGLDDVAQTRIRSLVTVALEIIYQCRPADRMDRKHFASAARFLIRQQRRTHQFCGSVALTSCHILPSSHSTDDELYEVFGTFSKLGTPRAYTAVVSYDPPQCMMKSFHILTKQER